LKGNASASVTALAMAAELAMQSEDFIIAADICDRMMSIAQGDMHNPPHQHAPSSLIVSASEACWKTAFQVSRQLEYPDTSRKIHLLGQALNLCPANQVLNLLTVFRSLEVTLHSSSDYGRREGRIRTSMSNRGRVAPSLVASQLRDFRTGLISSTFVPSEAAAMASRTLNRVTARLPFGKLRSEASGHETDGPRSGSPDVSSQARQAFSKGIGWLIGSEESGNLDQL